MPKTKNLLDQISDLSKARIEAAVIAAKISGVVDRISDRLDDDERNTAALHDDVSDARHFIGELKELIGGTF